MFIETHIDNDLVLTFVKSADIQAYPCGRRRSDVIDNDGDNNTTSDRYRIPFDPEARLNTEANNRKHSSLNGYTQTYLNSWEDTDKLLTLSLAGYLFTITLPSSTTSKNTFGTNVIDALKAGAEDAEIPNIEAANRIYANILLEDIHLFEGFKKYYTTVLRNQSAGTPELSLDLLQADIEKDGSIDDRKDFNNYYFSGLSFSVEPLTGVRNTRSAKEIDVIRDTVSGTTVKQTLVSLCILEKVQKEINGELTSVWDTHKPALLPKIKHGTAMDSIVVGETTATKITTPIANVASSLNVSNDNNDATATINNATIGSVDITTAAISDTLTVKNTAGNATADVNSLQAGTATIGSASVTTSLNVGTDVIAQGTVAASIIRQDGRTIPYITLSEEKQLQIWLDGSDTRIK